MPDKNDLVFKAASFAACAHEHHTRKDGKTPYISHPFRVCLVVRHVFGFSNPEEMLAAALLHDTIEDTTTDYDNIKKEFGSVVASWVAMLSKDKRLEDKEGQDGREVQFRNTLGKSPWQVKVIKLADLYDNLGDVATFAGKNDEEIRKQKEKTVKRSREYLEAVRHGLPPEAATAVVLVEDRIRALESGLTAS